MEVRQRHLVMLLLRALFQVRRHLFGLIGITPAIRKFPM
jgi:hypothetical protein